MSLPRPSRRALLTGLAALCLGPALVLALTPGPAAAHALVMSSQPEAGSTLTAPPTEVMLRFNSRIDHERSRLILFGPDRTELPLTLAAGHDAAVVEAEVPVRLKPGAWRLRWQVLAVDGHITRGDVFFTVNGR